MAKQLGRGNWTSENWRRLKDMIERNAFQGRYACFDFDDTTSIHAVDYALFSYQIHTLRFAIQPQKFSEVLATGLDDLDRVLGENAEGRQVRCAELIEDLSWDYDWFCRNGVLGANDTILRQVRQEPEYRDFAAKFHWLRKMLDRAYPMEVAYPWCLYPLAGFTPDQVYCLGREAIAYAAAEGRYGMALLRSPETRKGAAGRIRATAETGLRFPREMVDLYQTLQANGITTYLVSASPAELVRAGSDLANLGVPPERIFAMRGLRDQQGRYTCAYDHDWLEKGRYVQTFGPGKSQAIARFIAPAHEGRGPLLVCGDAESDMDMMTDWMACGDTELGLILDHRRDSVSHPRLCRAARDAVENPNSSFLLQGLEKVVGRFCPAQITTGAKRGITG